MGTFAYPKAGVGAVDVVIENIAKTSGETPALHGVSLEISGGELITLLGPSGSGKTTLLRILAGLEFPTAGRALFGDDDAATRTVQEHNVGFVVQHYALSRHMTVFDNVAFGLKVRPRGRRPRTDAIRMQVLRLLDLVQLSGLERRYPAQLSGGQRQRVALAIEPRILLLDEPFGALDARVRKDLRRWLRKLHDRTGHTTVFVTHDQNEAIELADRVVVKSQGRIEQVGSADDIYDCPATRFVFDFIGQSSMLPVTVERGRLRMDDHVLALDPGSRPDGGYTLAFRPHDAITAAGGAGAIAGGVVGNRRIGGTRRLDLEVGRARYRAAVDVPVNTPLPDHGRLAFIPTRWALYERPTASSAVPGSEAE